MLRHKGFTLIELLVVVAIIALLISILLPSLGAARENARSAVCLAKLHALGIGVNTYTTDYSNQLPDWVGSKTILRYISPQSDPNDPTDAPAVAYMKYQRCPSCVMPFANDKALTYAYNSNAFSSNFVKLSMIKRPNEIIALGDANQVWWDGGSWWVFDWSGTNFDSGGPFTATQKNKPIPPSWTKLSDLGPYYGNLDFDQYKPNPNKDPVPATSLRYRHGQRLTQTSGSANAIFFDFHAEPIKANKLTLNNIAVSY